MEYIYNIDKICHKNIESLKIKKNRKIYICFYQVLFKINSSQENPFLQYLLYKYPKEDDVNEIVTFPFVKYTSGNIKSLVKTRIKNITNVENPEYKGYIEFNENLFVFFGMENKNYIFKKLQEQNKFWFVNIDEICNQRKIIYYDIHDSVTNLFLNNSELIYLYDKNNNKLEIPTTAYRGDHIDILTYLAVFGQRRSTRSRFGPFYTLGTLNWAIKYAGWSKNYQKHTFQGKAITDNNGKYLKGGIIRYALFLGDLEKNYVLINNNKNYFKYLIDYQDIDRDLSKTQIEEFQRRKIKETGKWAAHYSSIIIPKIKYKKNSGYFNINTEYIISDSNNKITLSIHEINTKFLPPVWNPLYNNYKLI